MSKVVPIAKLALEDQVALELAERFKDELRYVSVNGQWLRWTGSCWRPERTLAVFDIARSLLRKVGKARPQAVAGVEKLARADRRLAATVEQWDNDPMILATPGGTVDLKTGELRPARREDYCSKQAGATPVEAGGARPLRWLEFMETVTRGDQELIDFLHRLCGYCLTGDISEHVFVFLFGTGRNGKGVFCRTLINVLGDYANTSPIEAFLETKHDRHSTEIARLFNMRLTVAQETPKGRAWDTAKIKNITGGDAIAAHFMRQDFFDFLPLFKLLIAGNHKPKLKVVDEAIRARTKLVPFTVTIPAADIDPDLADKLRAEYPAILRLFIDACLDWQEQRLGTCKAVSQASEDYFHEQDDIALWLKQRTVPRQRAFALSRDCYADWQSWCVTAEIEEPGNKTAFTRSLQDRGLSYGHDKRGGFFRDIALLGSS